MTSRARICPNCRRLNAAEDTVCYNCGAHLPGQRSLQVRELVSGLLGHEQPGARFYLVLCVGIYLFTALSGEFRLMGGISRLDSFRWGALYPGVDEPWRYLSAMFVHYGLLHIFFNMLTLNDLGRMLEPRLGTGRFLCAFLSTGIAGFIASDLWQAWLGDPAPTAGASGGLLGLIGVFVGLLYARRDPAWKQVLGRVLVYSLIFALAFPANNAAHAGGLVAGCLLGYWFGREPRPGLNKRSYNVVATALVVASIGSIIASHISASAIVREQQGTTRLNSGQVHAPTNPEAF